VLREADYLIELGPGAGRQGGQVIARGTVEGLTKNKASLIGPHIAGTEQLILRKQTPKDEMFDKGRIQISISDIHTLHHVEAAFPLGRLTAVTGVSGAGKTALVLDSLVPAMNAAIHHTALPTHIAAFNAGGIKKIVTVDAAPIGRNERSTVATYSGVFDAVRDLFAKTPYAKKRGWDAGWFSYNTKGGVCPSCEGTGRVVVDLQFMPNMELVCPLCKGRRYSAETLEAKWTPPTSSEASPARRAFSIADVLELGLEEALTVFKGEDSVYSRIKPLVDLGLGYLTLGEATPALSGGEAQRLKLVSEMGKTQKGALFVFDEPTTGLHPRDIRTLIRVFDALLAADATIIVIEHDLDLIANADYVIDMGPGGGDAGGKIVAQGTPAEITKVKTSLTGKYLARYMERFKH
jgi:excinuclease ABC subunit A